MWDKAKRSHFLYYCKNNVALLDLNNLFWWGWFDSCFSKYHFINSELRHIFSRKIFIIHLVLVSIYCKEFLKTKYEIRLEIRTLWYPKFASSLPITFPPPFVIFTKINRSDLGYTAEQCFAQNNVLHWLKTKF